MYLGRCPWLRRCWLFADCTMWRRRCGCGLQLTPLYLLLLLLLLLSAQQPRRTEPGTGGHTPGESRQDRQSPPQHSALELIPFDSFSEDQFIVATDRAARSRPRRRVYRLLRAARRTEDPGDGGRPVLLNPEPAGRQLERLGVEKRGFNEIVSERISLHRRLPEDTFLNVVVMELQNVELRTNGTKSNTPELSQFSRCLQQEYSQKLPTASIIICFHNEAWSTLLRTVNSVMDTAPKKFLKEIILVDDLSNQGHLKAALSEYISKLDGVKLIRSNKRLGVIGGRTLGAARATGDVLIFMDSHCECHNGWLEPLLDRIANDRTRVVSPIIDVIDWKTFQYYHSVDPQRGVFNWKLDFHWEPIPEYEQKWRKSPTSPIQSPAVSGGVLGINRHYFQNIGAYDPAMLMWGTENVELSLRTEVPDCMERLQLRKRLSCKNFHWFLTNIYPELYVPEDKSGYAGAARQRFLLHNIGTGYCAGYETKWSTGGYPVALAPCSGNGNQHFEYNSVREIRFGAIVQFCIDVRNEQVILQNCHRGKKMESEQQWDVQKSGEIIHVLTGKCIEAIKNGTSKDLFLRPCNKYTSQQLWRFEEVIAMNKR
ncbi:polypeptide N-acetylgalactosaminyltransferase 15-like isoform X3 [Carcharodon carcharias]|uniref:polypeptide N-acetylgalactosaminyltransferase 15-like isoform X3 n=1 Tax=Carcharodon carcharias TaxID=13397 RepID=UPI001B7D99E1|nr:polypeptide N-acetylgalactosaminyltransferase 15-like isoform X3 [Carcharodon carcharias]